ncbi:MAG: glycosyltransferase family 2 protein [Bacteroidales bacterium]|nr:glycosyltransferase family 2 protein [Bacteroidales bacterium]MBQ6578852.1 glycosyltransferase family 2 protein [Bacteroidales bacterium]
MMTVAVLMTSFNRREKTLACLDSCFREIEAIKAQDLYSFTVYLVDDGSTDGTAEAIEGKYPQVRILKGDGTLFWNQGMRLAWNEAAKDDYDFYLWLNDDTVLLEGSLESIMETSQFLRHKAIIAGTATNPEGEITYGGRNHSGKLVEPEPTIPVPCYTFNGNVVLVPRYAYNILGNLEERYHHTFGDFDYGVRAVKANVSRVVAPGIVCICSRNPGVPKWRDSNYSLKERYAFLLSPKGRPPREQFLYDTRDKGLLWAIGHAVSLNFKVLFPSRNNQENQ